MQVNKDYTEDLPRVPGNAGKLQQVFTNLLLNARDAVSEGGIITLKTGGSDNDDYIRVEVADNGYGIQPETLSKIFDPFFTTKEVGSGTGLGLAVTYGIVQEHSGSITAKSELGKGTTFTLDFPVAQIDAKGVS